MKALIFSATVLLAAACTMHKKNVDNVLTDDNSLSQVDAMTVGTVHVGQKECPLFIETKEEDMIVTMYPINLDEKLQIDGSKIKFSYHPSKARQPENCAVDKVVALENVSQINN